MSEIPEGLALRDVNVIDPGAADPGGSYEIARPEWAKAARIIAKGGDAAKPDGSPGDDGYVIVEWYGKTEENS
jgi:hypothetical protein